MMNLTRLISISTWRKLTVLKEDELLRTIHAYQCNTDDVTEFLYDGFAVVFLCKKPRSNFSGHSPACLHKSWSKSQMQTRLWSSQVLHFCSRSAERVPPGMQVFFSRARSRSCRRHALCNHWYNVRVDSVFSPVDYCWWKERNNTILVTQNVNSAISHNDALMHVGQLCALSSWQSELCAEVSKINDPSVILFLTDNATS